VAIIKDEDFRVGRFPMIADKSSGGANAPLSHDEIVGICGDILDWKVKAIVDTSAGPSELEVARAWAAAYHG
jgi:hypothetical protein